MSEQIIVELAEISKSFGGSKLLDRVSFKLSAGQITTLIGQNGAGKTTIAKIILGLEKYDSGNVRIQDGLKVGYIPQKLDFNYNIPLTGSGLLNILAPSGNLNDFHDMKEFLDYESVKNKDISSISGGQLQKLILIGTLMNKPDLVIMDEPTQFLDVSSQQKFYSIMDKLKKSMNLAIFMISHDLFTVMKNSDQVICLNGHVCCSGKPSDAYNEQTSNDIFKSALSEIGVYIHNHDHKHK